MAEEPQRGTFSGCQRSIEKQNGGRNEVCGIGGALPVRHSGEGTDGAAKDLRCCAPRWSDGVASHTLQSGSGYMLVANPCLAEVCYAGIMGSDKKFKL